MNNRYREEELEEKKNDANELVDEVVLDETNEVKTESNEVNKNTEELEAEVKKYKDLYLRTVAETENYKKRINEERIRERKYASQSLIEKLVNALDIFDKTVNFQTDDEKIKNFLIGFEMINNNLKQILEDEGVKKIVAINQAFNPTVHHAIEISYNEEIAEDIIVEEFQTGYTYKDRVLRPALVKVNKKNNKEEK